MKIYNLNNIAIFIYTTIYVAVAFSICTFLSFLGYKYKYYLINILLINNKISNKIVLSSSILVIYVVAALVCISALTLFFLSVINKFKKKGP